MENLVDCLLWMIKNLFWYVLMWCIDGDGLEIICVDLKNWMGCVNLWIYVLYGEFVMVEYYWWVVVEKLYLNLDVQVFLVMLDDLYFVKSLNYKFGIFVLVMNEVSDGKGGKMLKGILFVVLGVWFNEVSGVIVCFVGCVLIVMIDVVV